MILPNGIYRPYRLDWKELWRSVEQTAQSLNAPTNRRFDRDVTIDANICELKRKMKGREWSDECDFSLEPKNFISQKA